MEDIPLQDLKHKDPSYNPHSEGSGQYRKTAFALHPNAQESHGVQTSQDRVNTWRSHLEQCDYCRQDLASLNVENGASGLSSQSLGIQDPLSLGEKSEHRQRELSSERLGRWLQSPHDEDYVINPEGTTKPVSPEPGNSQSNNSKLSRTEHSGAGMKYSKPEDGKSNAAYDLSADLEDSEDVSSDDYTDFADWLREQQ